MVKYLKIIVLVAMTAWLFNACSTDEAVPVDFGKAYFPLTQKHWVEYKLDSVIYDDFDNTVRESHWDLRVEVADSIPDGEGSFVNRIKRYFKPRGSNDPYVLQDVWFAKLDGTIVESIEENLRFLRLSLPPTEGKTWQGNQFIDTSIPETEFYENWDYFYDKVGTSLTINGLNFSDVIHVNESNEKNAIQHYVAESYYARDVGLVKKKLEIVVEDSATSDKSIPVIERTDGRRGFAVYMEVTDYAGN